MSMRKSVHQSTSKKVCVIGGGASGLVAARELRKEGHEVVVFERGSRLGGFWVYSPHSESDSLGVDPTRQIVHSSLYASLRTNVAREAMGFTDFPFVPTGKAGSDSRRFPGHQEVLRYLEEFAQKFELNELIRYQTEVTHVSLEADRKWLGLIFGQGSKFIATTIVHLNLIKIKDIAGFAKEVHVTTRSEAVGRFGKHPVYDNMWLHPMKEPMKMVEYHFKMELRSLQMSFSIVLGPLYKHVFPPTLAPGPSFVGVPSFVIPFVVYGLQSKWIAGVLSGKISLPSEEKMVEDIETFYSELEAKGVPKRYTHKIHDFKDWLAAQSGSPSAEEWRKGIFFGAVACFFKQPETYKDVYDDEDLIAQAYEDFMQYLSADDKAFELNELIRYQTKVTHVGLEKDGTWIVKYKRTSEEDESSEMDEIYDDVVVCNGHFTKPLVADNIPGIELWPGKQVHSHNYRTPEPYTGKVVVLIGFSASAFDISRDLVKLAKEVHITTRFQAKELFGKHPVYPNLWLHQMIERVHEDGCVMNVDDNRVGPLYKHVFPPTLAPGISFVGIPSFAFYLDELPFEEKMKEDVEAFYSKLEAKRVPKRYTRKIHDYKNLGSFEYEDWLARQCGCPPIEEWRKRMFFATIDRVFKQKQDSHDEWVVDNLVLEEKEEFYKLFEYTL
ncbi:Flavin-containing monooxygenase FMO GS-OX-like 7 [Bienertia sinuspersici]